MDLSRHNTSESYEPRTRLLSLDKEAPIPEQESRTWREGLEEEESSSVLHLDHYQPFELKQVWGGWDRQHRFPQ